MENDMTQIATPILTEALKAAQSLIPPQNQAAYDRAEKEWGSVATTNSGKFAVISAAQANEESAKLYLLHKMLDDGRIKKTLWRFLGPNPSFQRARIEQGDTAIYVSLVSEALEQILQKWNRKAVTKGVDYFTNLQMQVANRVITNTRKYNTEQNRGGMTGKIMKGEETPKIGSYEVYNDKNDVYSNHDPYKGHENLDAWESFIDDASLDKGPNPTIRQVLKYFLNSGAFDAKAAGKEFGKTHQTIYTKLASLKSILERHEISQDSFMNLLQVVGAQDLAKTL
jgi:hypothetical protein